MLTPAQRTLQANERCKLLAAAIDRASTGVLLVGVIAPLAAGGSMFGGSGLYWIAAAVGLHVAAQVAIGMLR